MNEKEVVEYVLTVLKKYKIKNVEVKDNIILFISGSVRYGVQVDSAEEVVYYMDGIEGEDVPSSLNVEDEWANYKYIDEFVFWIVNEKPHQWVVKLVKKLEAIKHEFEDKEQYIDIIAYYFDLIK